MARLALSSQIGRAQRLSHDKSEQNSYNYGMGKVSLGSVEKRILLVDQDLHFSKFLSGELAKLVIW